MQTYSRRTGFGLGGDLTEPTPATSSSASSHPRRDDRGGDGRGATQIEQTIPGLDIEPAQLMEDLIGDLTGRRSRSRSSSSPTTRSPAELPPKVADAIGKSAGRRRRSKPASCPPATRSTFEVDRVKAALEGVDADAITKQLDDLLSGNVTTQIQHGEKMVDVRVWIPEAIVRTTRDLANLIARPTGICFR